jgi:hypothetical protein
MTLKAEITLEIEETVVLKQGGNFVTEYCPRCQQTVDMVSPGVLSLIAGVSEREIFRLIESGAIHFFETSRLVACLSCYGHLLTSVSIDKEQ